VKQITEAWQKSVASVIETGNLLAQAKKDLEHGEWLPMIESDLPFETKTAQRLMIIARHPLIGNGAHAHHLPASWMTLYELTKMDKKLGEGALEKRISDGKITPKTERKEVLKMLRVKRAAPLRDINTVILQECTRYEKITESAQYKCLREIIKYRDGADQNRVDALADALNSYVSLLTECVEELQKPASIKIVRQQRRKLA